MQPGYLNTEGLRRMEIFRAVIHFILQRLGASSKISPLNTHTNS